jgi:hypothetical protein
MILAGIEGRQRYTIRWEREEVEARMKAEG